MVCVNNCKGICNKFKATHPGSNQGRYDAGQKRCQQCGKYINYEGIFCPCCGYRLRLGRRSKVKTKAILN